MIELQVFVPYPPKTRKLLAKRGTTVADATNEMELVCRERLAAMVAEAEMEAPDEVAP